MAGTATDAGAVGGFDSKSSGASGVTGGLANMLAIPLLAVGGALVTVFVFLFSSYIFVLV